MPAKSPRTPTTRTWIRRAKAAGMSIDRAYEMLTTGRQTAAARDKWRPSELAATLASDLEDFVLVYGKRAAAHLFPGFTQR